MAQPTIKAPNFAKLGEGLQAFQGLLYLGLILGILFIGYKVFQTFAAPYDPEKASVADNIVNNALSIGQSSESYTEAAGTIFTQPWNSLKSILGIN